MDSKIKKTIRIIMKADLNKFSFAQMTSNSDGKTSGSGTMGALVITVGAIGFLMGVCDFMWGTQKDDVLMYASGIITVGAGLLGYRKKQATEHKKAENAAPTPAPAPEAPKEDEPTI